MTRPAEALLVDRANLLTLTAPGHYKTIDTVNGVEVAPATA